MPQAHFSTDFYRTYKSYRSYKNKVRQVRQVRQVRIKKRLRLLIKKIVENQVSYMHKKKAESVANAEGVQFPNGFAFDSVNHNIADVGIKVKPQTEMPACRL